jgi:GH25 family lysozyme M1 (1,4-beta-N-acetylmuramidase)
MPVSPLIVDLYAGDLGGKPDIATLVAAGPPWHGLILKATEGTSYNGGQWFKTNWPAARDLAADRYGADWFRGAYCYVHFDQARAHHIYFYLHTIAAAGGGGQGDFWPVLDVERAGNPDVSASQIVTCVSTMAGLLKARLGRDVTLYGGSLLYDKGIRDHMGCSRLWIARYTATLPAIVYQRIGWELDDLLMWQYDGDGEGYLANYPTTSPIGRTDISALTIAGGGDAALAYLRTNLFAEAPTT